MAKGIRFLPVLLALGLPFTGVTQTTKSPSQPKASAQAPKSSPSATPTKPSTAASRAKSPTAAKASTSSAKTSPPSTQKAAARPKTAQATTSKAAQKTAAKTPAKTATKSKARTAAKRRTPARPAIQQQPTPERYREIQQALIDRGFLQGEPTGTWDSDSVEALKRFQADQQLPPTGKIDALTLIRLGLGPKRQNLAANPLLPPPSESESQP